MSRSPIEIQRLLPRTNCRECGLPSCMAFAVKFLKGEKRVGDCPPLQKPEYIGKRIALKEVEAEVQKSTPTRLVIRGDLCTGCGNCVVACPLNVSVSQDVSGGKGPLTKDVIMGVKDGTITVLNIDICRRNESEMQSEPCRICIDSCPIKGAIDFI
ncbi:MAG: tRNA CCA-pyrophosphorylase [Methanobacteriota archaeon]|nr:MAG: tRNA CCA-pyrophosphorylase [Euryarchaeota archaeon]